MTGKGITGELYWDEVRKQYYSFGQVYDNEKDISAARFYYHSRVQPNERNAGLEKPNLHPTLKPVDLCRWLALLLLPPERETPRTLLVPFAGAGSEMIGAHLAGWDRIIGVELEPEYVEIQRRRCAWWAEHGAAGVDTETVLVEGQARSEEMIAGQLELTEAGDA